MGPSQPQFLPVAETIEELRTQLRQTDALRYQSRATRRRTQMLIRQSHLLRASGAERRERRRQ